MFRKLYSKYSCTHYIVVIIFLILALWLCYMGWSTRIATRSILMRDIPEFTTYITVGSALGFICAGRATYFRPVNKTSKHVLEMFCGGFCFGFACSLNFYDVYSYLLPGETIQYQTDYEISFPGPSLGKSGHCEAGLWFKDFHTDRWIQLCTNKTNLAKQRKSGMNNIWVTAHTTNIGTYIIDYEFIYK